MANNCSPCLFGLGFIYYQESIHDIGKLLYSSNYRVVLPISVQTDTGVENFANEERNTRISSGHEKPTPKQYTITARRKSISWVDETYLNEKSK